MIDLFTVKPVDKATVVRCAQATGGRLITVEDHYPEGGIGSAVAEAISDVTGDWPFHYVLSISSFAVIVLAETLLS